MSIEGSVQQFKKSIFKIAVVIGILLYIFMPLDIIPDVPIIGWIDDLAIAVAGCSYIGYDLLRLKPKAKRMGYQEVKKE